MKKITQKSAESFLNFKPFKLQNTEVKVDNFGATLYLFGDPIAYLKNDDKKTLKISNRGWFSNTTKERLNDLPNVRIQQKKGEWYLNSVKWDGNLIEVK